MILKSEVFMKQDKYKKMAMKFGALFFVVVLFLTYFSKTIDNLLLPKVKVSDVITGSLSEYPDTMHTHYLLPLSSVVSEEVYVIFTDEKGEVTVNAVSVNICGSNDLYYEVTSESLFSDMQVVYKTSKEIFDGDRVYVEEGG